MEEDGHLALLLSSLISGFLRACGRGVARLAGGSLRRKPGGPGRLGESGGGGGSGREQGMGETGRQGGRQYKGQAGLGL